MNLPPLLRHLPSALAFALPAIAQDFETPVEVSAPVVTAPSGYLDQPASGGFALTEALSGVTYGLSTSLAYDSNVRGSGVLTGAAEDDTIWTISPVISYRDPGGALTFGGSLALNHSTYFSNSDLGGLGYDAKLFAGYTGGRFKVNADFGSSLTQGTNTNYNNTYAETLRFTTGLSLDYTLSPKTSISSRYNYSWSEPDTGAFSTTYDMGFDIAALWRAGVRTTVGPGLAWNLSGGDKQPDRESLGPILRLQYKLTAKLALDSTFGLQFVESGAGGQDDTFTTSLGLSYRASSRSSMNLSVFKGTVANGGLGGGFRDTTSVRLGYNHRIRRATLGLGLDYESSDFSGGAPAPGREQDTLTFDTSLGLPVFYNRANAAVFYRLRDSSGANAQSIDGYTCGLSLSTSF